MFLLVPGILNAYGCYWWPNVVESLIYEETTVYTGSKLNTLHYVKLRALPFNIDAYPGMFVKLLFLRVLILLIQFPLHEANRTKDQFLFKAHGGATLIGTAECTYIRSQWRRSFEDFIATPMKMTCETATDFNFTRGLPRSFELPLKSDYIQSSLNIAFWTTVAGVLTDSFPDESVPTVVISVLSVSLGYHVFDTNFWQVSIGVQGARIWTVLPLSKKQVFHDVALTRGYLVSWTGLPECTTKVLGNSFLFGESKVKKLGGVFIQQLTGSILFIPPGTIYSILNETNAVAL